MAFWQVEMEKSQIIGFTLWADDEETAREDAKALAHEGHLPITAYPLSDPSFRLLDLKAEVAK